MKSLTAKIERHRKLAEKASKNSLRHCRNGMRHGENRFWKWMNVRERHVARWMQLRDRQ